MNSNDRTRRQKTFSYEEIAERRIAIEAKVKAGELHYLSERKDPDEFMFEAEGLLPSHLELAQLAATLKQGENIDEFNPKNAVSCALDIWEEAHLQLLERYHHQVKLKNLSQQFEDALRLDFAGHLKIGRHYFPPLDDDKFLSSANIKFDQLLEFITGLARKEDRIVWFRLFLKSQYRLKLLKEKSPELYKERIMPNEHGYGWYRYPTEEESPISDNDDKVADTIEHLRNNGLDFFIDQSHKLNTIFHKNPTDRLELAIIYRKWRAGMKTKEETIDLTDSIKIEDFIKKGLEWSESGRE